MALAFTFLASLFDTTNAKAYSTASYTPAANAVLIAVVQNTKAAATAYLPVASGNGLTWVQIDTAPWYVTTSALTRTTTFYALTGSSPAEGAFTATLNEALNTTGVCIEVVQFTGCDLTTPIVQHAMTAHVLKGGRLVPDLQKFKITLKMAGE